ncbi:MAG: radical SAM protein [Deltaproteobacteria bacterium]|nr:radical SAM protein [Deltaproteobacteria bacterium]
MLADYQGRGFSALRVSITKACNLACSYCVPDDSRHTRLADELSAEEMFEAIKLLYEVLDLKKIRLTGGEPLVSPKLNKLLPLLSELPIKDFSLTTNGQLLSEKIPLLVENRVKRINVSLDTLKPDKFAFITRQGKLEKTLRGIEDALDAGLKIKVNMIPIKDVNEDEVVALLDYCLERGIELRYIELMRMGHLSERSEFENKFWSMEKLLCQIRGSYHVQAVDSESNATAQRFAIPETGYFGVIANDSAPFCQTCNRLRLTSNGDLYGCLSSPMKYSMSSFLGGGDKTSKEELKSLLSAALATKQQVSFYGSNLEMKSVGG